tara:strand:+ start:58 stop:210 length:153 start_codon:yes stop_codon:yes gene_type:complete
MEFVSAMFVMVGAAGIPFLINRAIGELKGIRNVLEQVATDPKAMNVMETK